MAGANGIGKSTFLSTVNFALTGAVPHPRRRLLSTGQYLKEAQDYTSSYFEGRITEEDRDLAAISVEFRIGERRYSLTRPIFTPTELRDLKIWSGAEVYVDGTVLTPVQRENQFKENLCQDIGMQSFEQFVFFQHFLLTFDEARHLLFWDESAATQMLYLCFGGDVGEAARADELNREMEKAGSWGRNLQFQASNLAKRIELIESSAELDSRNTDLEAAGQLYQTKSESVARASKKIEDAEHRLAEADLRVAQANAAVAALRVSYSEAFNALLESGSNPRKHPLVQDALQTGACPVCRTSSEAVKTTIEAKLDSGHCPLCSSAISEAGAVPNQSRVALAALDSRLAKAREALNEASALQARLSLELKRHQEELMATRAALTQFEKDNEDVLGALKARVAASQSALLQNLAALQQAREQLILQRDEAYAERDTFRDQLRLLQKDLQRRYAKAEREFVPLFRGLSEMFLGIDLDVSLANQGTSMSLDIEMRGTSRREQHQLSESQRFFVDIALRMAIAEYTSAPNGKATILIDTPEGSLDIAYEDRAGRMFANFALSGHSLLMTANINTSKLLTSMATHCGADLMRLVPMTGWSELSDVQQEASALFKAAYDEIDIALRNASPEAPRAKS
jgi:DNA repair exonuclease SbcCD ATPase subunit